MTEKSDKQKGIFWPEAPKELPSCPGWKLVDRLDGEASKLTQVWRLRKGSDFRIFKLCSPDHGASTMRQRVDSLKKEVEFRDRVRNQTVHFVDYIQANLEDAFAPFVSFKDYPLGSLFKAMCAEHPWAHRLNAEPIRLEIVAIAAEAIAAFHDAKVYHGDVRAANLLLDENFVPRWTDFGLAPSWVRPQKGEPRAAWKSIVSEKRRSRLD